MEKDTEDITQVTSDEFGNGNASIELMVKASLEEEAREHKSPELPRCTRIKKYSNTFIFRTLLVIIFTTAIVLIRRMDQMSYQPITEEEAIEMAQEVKVTLPDQKIQLLDTHENLDLKTGTTVKVLGVYKQKLNKGNSPRVYWADQYYLMELPDGSRGCGPLMETAIGQKTVLPEGDTAIITAVKKGKNKPTVQSTGETSHFDYAYTLDGHKDAYALEDLHIYFPQRVAYLGGGLTEDKYIVTNDTLSENKSGFQKVKKFFLYDLRPITKKNGFFLFPKHQEWNEFLLKRWFRILMIVLAYIVEIFLIFRILPNLRRIFKRIGGISRFSMNYKKAELGNPSACYKVAEACESGMTTDGLTQSNYPQAMKWYKKAADIGYADAYARLGQIYEFGEFRCVDKDEIEAYKWYKRGLNSNAECDEGINRIIQKRSSSYYFDLALTANAAKDYKTAFNALQKAVINDNPDAQLLLGMYYNNGYGCRQDQAAAAKWIRKAAEQGNARAQFTYGGMLSFGNGVRKDENEGLQWIKKAARQGYQEAVNVLKNSNIPY